MLFWVSTAEKESRLVSDAFGIQIRIITLQTSLSMYVKLIFSFTIIVNMFVKSSVLFPGYNVLCGDCVRRILLLVHCNAEVRIMVLIYFLHSKNKTFLTHTLMFYHFSHF